MEEMETGVTLKENEQPKNTDNGEDIFLVIGNKKLKFDTQISPIYAVKEYFLKTKLNNGDDIKFVRNNGTEIPTRTSANSGFTLVGKARDYFFAGKALIANGETSDAQEYIYINEHTTLTYIGDNKEHTFFIRVYDNLNGTNNDRWLVIYID